MERTRLRSTADCSGHGPTLFPSPQPVHIGENPAQARVSP